MSYMPSQFCTWGSQSISSQNDLTKVNWKTKQNKKPEVLYISGNK